MDEILKVADSPDGDIALAALSIAAQDFPGLDIQPYLAVIDSIAQTLRADLDQSRRDPVEGLAKVMREQLQLRGAGGGDPSAHYLHTVIDKQCGIPIACSSLWIAVGKRAEVEVEGIALPGHFVVRVNGQFADPFSGGDTLDDTAMRRIVGKALGSAPIILDPIWLQPADIRGILRRMCRTLEEWDMALTFAHRCVLLAQDEPRDLRDRGLIYWRIGDAKAALADLSRYLDANPTATDRQKIEEVVGRLRASLN
jgi:regulator of sirC expression with transglutaminase-like and TPR domain